jgi:hypothetical protein
MHQLRFTAMVMIWKPNFVLPLSSGGFDCPGRQDGQGVLPAHYQTVGTLWLLVAFGLDFYFIQSR